MATHSAASLASLKELAEAGKLRPAIDRVYPIRETPEAMRRIESGAAAGKVVISIG